MSESIFPQFTSENTRAADFFRAHQKDVYKRTSRMFAILFPLQWLAAILVAYIGSPLSWQGEKSSVNPHVWFAIFVGGSITILPFLLSLFRPEDTLTRHVVAIGQMLMSAVLIHVTGGRIETHFHIFGSLAFLAFYRDWKVILSATIVTATDHLVRGWLFPYSIYGVVTVDHLRWFEHSGWVIFTDIFLLLACKHKIREMKDIAARSAFYVSSEERYRAVVEQTSDAIALLDIHTLQVIDCNRAFCELLGYDDVELARQFSAYDFTTVSPEQIDRLLSEMMANRSSTTGERRYRRLDGSIVEVDICADIISYEGKETLCMNAKNITERKHAQAEMNRLALVAQKTQHSVIVYSPEARIEWVNDGFTRLTGYQIDEVIGRDPAEFMFGEETDRATLKMIYATVEKHLPVDCEMYNYKKNGQGYWVSISLTPLKDKAGNLQGYISIEMDITERKAMEEQLRMAYDDLEMRVTERTVELVRANELMRIEANERERAEQAAVEAKEFLDTVIDNVPNLIFVKDVKGNFVLVNKALADIFGTTTDKLIGKTDADFTHNPDEARRFTENDIHTMNTMEEKFIPEEQHTDAAGNVHWFQTVKRPVELGVSKTKYLIGVATDFTERKIMESQLRHSQKLESIGQLAAGIAHEINTPTQYVGDNTRFARDAFKDITTALEKYNGLLDAAKSGSVPPELLADTEEQVDSLDLEYLLEEVPNALQQSLEGVSRIAKIVQSMKDFAHPGTRDKQTVDLNRAIESTVTVARNEWKYVADLETNFDTHLPPVPCYLGEFNQVVLNMVINAAHAIGDVVGDGSQGKGKITISTTQVEDKWAEVRIADTGAGIPDAIRSRVFDPFFTTKEVGKGTGQGLAISHTVVVEKHGGQLSFESESAKGTTFIIRLPLNNFDSSEQEVHNND